MAPPPGLFSMMTGWPRLSDNFCPKTLAIMSLPPPAVKPTMIWIGRVGYLAGSSCAKAGQVTAVNPKPRAAEKRLRETFMDWLPLKRRDVDMQHRGLAILQRRET